MLFSWFDTNEVSNFGVKLAEDLSRELSKVNSKHSKKEIVNRSKVIQNVFKQFDNLKDKTALNFYKKSKLINEFKWRLSDLGHDNEFIDIMTKELLIYINR